MGTQVREGWQGCVKGANSGPSGAPKGLFGGVKTIGWAGVM